VALRRSPCELYIRSLVCHPKRYTNDRIREIVRSKGLDYIGGPYVDRLRAGCAPPRPFYPFNKNHSRSNRFLVKEGLTPIFQPKTAMKLANAILKDPSAKEIVESSLIARQEHAWIVSLLKRNGIHVSVEAVKLYKKFYFNIDVLDSSEVKALLELRASAEPSDDPDEQALQRHLSLARKSDPRRLASRSAISPLAGVMHQMRFGIVPGSVELANLAAASRVAATVQVLDSCLSGAAERARDFSIVAKTMTDILETVGSPEEELQRSLQQLSLRTEREDIPTIKQLSGGNHTVDIQPATTAQAAEGVVVIGEEDE